MHSEPNGRTAQLQALKLRALVREHLGLDPQGDPVLAGPVTGLVHAGEAWVLLSERAGLGAALWWARRQGGTSSVHVLAESGCGVLARRAALVSGRVSVWSVESRQLVAAPPMPRVVPPLSPDHRHYVEVIRAGGADPVVEHGVLTGEVAGLEVCVVVDDPISGTPVLDVGVGPHDREAFAVMYPGLDRVEAVAKVVAAVSPHRQPGAEPHPFNRLAAQRLLRHRALIEPGLVGLESLEVAEPPVARTGVADPAPCVGLGRSGEGQVCVVVFSTGVDPELVPFAVDARDHLAPAAVLVLAVPERDASAVRALSTGLLPTDPVVVGIPT